MRLCLISLVFLVSVPVWSLDNPQESRVLKMGKIRPGKVALGSVLALIPGFGVGHVVQGRYESKGWLFTLGEAGSMGLIGIEMATNGRVFPGEGVLGIVGISAFGFFKLWEFYDALVGALTHNKYYDQTKTKMDRSEAPKTKWAPFPVAGGMGLIVVF